MLIQTSYMLYVCFTFLLNGPVQKVDTFQGTIIDDASGELTPAKVYVTTLDGVRVEPEGDHEHVEYLSKTWCYSDGNFSVSAQHPELIVEIRKGLEYRAIKDTLRVDTENKPTFRMQRWVDMIAKGYVGGDIHGHYMLLDGPGFMEKVLLQMEAEDLPVLTILANEDNTVTPHFTGKPDAISTDTYKIYVGQEVRDWQMGHLTLIELSTLVDGYPLVGGVLRGDGRPHWLMNHAMHAARQQGGLVVWSHFSNLPGAESPIAIALGLVDAIELMTYNEPTDLPSHWSPWNNSGMPQAAFTIMRGMDLYYQYLNAGFVLPIVAGTDKMINDIPIGSNRYYAEFNGTDRYQDWVKGIKAGNGFITNGPMLDFTVDEYKPGDSPHFTGTRQVKARVVATSQLPFTTLEIVRNGEVVGHKTLSAHDNPPVNGVYTMEVDTVVALGESAWLAARVIDDPDMRNRILPRGLSVFAHTNPVYFYQDHEPIRVKASIAYLRRYVEATIHWLETNPPFANPKDRTEAIKLARKAESIYKDL